MFDHKVPCLITKLSRDNIDIFLMINSAMQTYLEIYSQQLLPTGKVRVCDGKQSPKINIIKSINKIFDA